MSYKDHVPAKMHQVGPLFGMGCHCQVLVWEDLTVRRWGGNGDYGHNHHPSACWLNGLCGGVNRLTVVVQCVGRDSWVEQVQGAGRERLFEVQWFSASHPFCRWGLFDSQHVVSLQFCGN